LELRRKALYFVQPRSEIFGNCEQKHWFDQPRSENWNCEQKHCVWLPRRENFGIHRQKQLKLTAFCSAAQPKIWEFTNRRSNSN
jgi:hypothetical protein